MDISRRGFMRTSLAVPLAPLCLSAEVSANEFILPRHNSKEPFLGFLKNGPHFQIPSIQTCSQIRSEIQLIDSRLAILNNEKFWKVEARKIREAMRISYEDVNKLIALEIRNLSKAEKNRSDVYLLLAITAVAGFLAAFLTLSQAAIIGLIAAAVAYLVETGTAIWQCFKTKGNSKETCLIVWKNTTFLIIDRYAEGLKNVSAYLKRQLHRIWALITNVLTIYEIVDTEISVTAARKKKNEAFKRVLRARQDINVYLSQADDATLIKDAQLYLMASKLELDSMFLRAKQNTTCSFYPVEQRISPATIKAIDRNRGVLPLN